MDPIVCTRELLGYYVVARAVTPDRTAFSDRWFEFHGSDGPMSREAAVAFANKIEGAAVRLEPVFAPC
jgi:hypothetical protein